MNLPWFLNIQTVRRVRRGGGTRLKRAGGLGMWALKNPLLHAPCFHKHPSWGTYRSIHKICIWKKNVTFCLQNQAFSENMSNFQLQKLKFSWDFHQIFFKVLQNISSQHHVFCCKIMWNKSNFLIKPQETLFYIKK